MIKTSVICVAIVIIVLAALPFGASAADSTNSQFGRTTVTAQGSDFSVDAKSVRYTTIRPNGDMLGIDNDGHRWTFTADAKRFQNLATGLTCVGELATRHCRPGSSASARTVTIVVLP